MKKILGLLLLITTTSYSQILEPVKWTTDTKKLSDTEYELIIVATIEQDYHLYSQNVPKNGPVPTTFIFEKSNNYN